MKSCVDRYVALSFNHTFKKNPHTWAIQLGKIAIQGAQTVIHFAGTTLFRFNFHGSRAFVSRMHIVSTHWDLIDVFITF